MRVVSSALYGALSEFVPNKPLVGTELISIFPVASQYRGGLVYIHNDTNWGYRLTYYLKGNKTNAVLGGV